MDVFRSESKLAEYATDLDLIFWSEARAGEGIDHAATHQIMGKRFVTSLTLLVRIQGSSQIYSD